MYKFQLPVQQLLVTVLLGLTLSAAGCSGFSNQSRNTTGASATLSVPAITSESNSTAQAIEADPTKALPVAPRVGALAPDFELYDLNRVEMSLNDFRGRPVLLNFWATW